MIIKKRRSSNSPRSHVLHIFLSFQLSTSPFTSLFQHISCSLAPSPSVCGDKFLSTVGVCEEINGSVCPAGKALTGWWADHWLGPPATIVPDCKIAVPATGGNYLIILKQSEKSQGFLCQAGRRRKVQIQLRTPPQRSTVSDTDRSNLPQQSAPAFNKALISAN